MPFKATAQSVKPVRPLPMPPLSNAPLVRMKKLLPVMPDILEILVMPLAKAVVLVPLQILEQVPGQPRVLLVPLVRIHYLPTLRHVRPVLRVATAPTRPRSCVQRTPTKSQPPATPVTGWSRMRVVRVMRLHTLFKATAQSVKPVLRVAKVPTRPQSRVLTAPIKSQPPVTTVTGWSKVRVRR
jgi:hypothetical protein